MKLIDYAKILRSKNAGPLFITFDLIFDTEKELDFIESKLKKEDISKAYNIDVSKIDIITFRQVNSLKITFPRKNVSGSILDTDIYGCQMHLPLANIEI